MLGLTGVCEGLDVVRQVDVHTLCVLHFLEDDPDEPHGHKVVPVIETQKRHDETFTSCSFHADFRPQVVGRACDEGESQ